MMRLGKRLFGLLSILSTPLLIALERVICLREPATAIDDLENLNVLIGDSDRQNLSKISSRPLHYFTSFPRCGGINSDEVFPERGYLTMSGYDLEEIFCADTKEHR